jgi:phosphonate transport system permease protein
VRSASVVGVVGAGRVGVVLWEVIRGFQYGETCAVIITIVVTGSLIDSAARHIRKHYL